MAGRQLVVHTLSSRSLPHDVSRPLRGTVTNGLLSSEECQALLEHENKILQQVLDNFEAANCNESVYTGGPGIALFLVKAASMRGELALLEKAQEALQTWQEKVDEDASRDPGFGCSLLCGKAGWLCVEALRCHAADDKDGAQQAAGSLAEMAEVAMSQQLDCDEWLYGRAGFLHGCLILRHVCGTSILPEKVVNDMSKAILKSGLDSATVARSPDGPPLLWRWSGQEYLGAAHGVMGIIFMLLHVEAVLWDTKWRQLIIDTMDWILAQKAENGNWPPIRGKPKADYLMHFCHGAPGAAHLFCKAYEVFGDSRYLAEARAAADMAWTYGMLKKGPGLCHGFAGNGYVFLAMYRASGEAQWIQRAYEFALTMFQPSIVAQCRTPDNPLSLFEGVAGSACFLLDLRLAPMTSALPFFEVGWLKVTPIRKLRRARKGDAEEKELAKIVRHNNVLSEAETAATGDDEEEEMLENTVTETLSATLGVERSEIDPWENQLRRRMHSALIIDFNSRLRQELPRKRVRPRLVFDHPSVRSMVSCLMGRCHCLMCRESRGELTWVNPSEEEWEREFADPPAPVVPEEGGEEGEEGAEENAEGEQPAAAAPAAAAEEEPQEEEAEEEAPAPEVIPTVVAPQTKMAAFSHLLAVPKKKVAADPLHEQIAPSQFSRATDGMICIRIPATTAWIGDGLENRAALPVEQPCHEVEISAFLMDVEPVSVGAYARFLNIMDPTEEQLQDWLATDTVEPVSKSLPVDKGADGRWGPVDGVSVSWPMINVTWFGANAYSLWANGGNVAKYKTATDSFLPTEAQWEYAARGQFPVNFPWGDAPAASTLLNVRWEPWPEDVELGDTPLQEMPISDVTYQLGLSPFGLRHMAGNVWQWCRDTYDPEFYSKEEASTADAWNAAPEGPKSERGGSWVGPSHLARSSYRRGRPAEAKGPCLGFRCVGDSSKVDAMASTAASEPGP